MWVAWIRKLFFVALVMANFSLLGSCIALGNDDNDGTPRNVVINSLRFIGEAVIPQGQAFEGTTVGGLSSIDYVNGEYYMISDDAVSADDSIAGPTRFYKASLNFDQNGFNSASITEVTEILNSNGTSFAANEADPESLRFDAARGSFVWVSEGFINNAVDPFVREMATDGSYVRDLNLPDLFKVNEAEGEGPEHNTSFEGLSLSVDGNGYWVAMEGPLAQDGSAPGFADTESAVRISYLESDSGEFGKQFVLELDPVFRLPANPGFQFSVSGVVEILEYATKQFLVLERSFATNYTDGGNNVKLYRVDASNATDVSQLSSLSGQTITKATKTLLFDFETIRGQLTNGIVDNIEGITFGPDLPNGNKSLVLVADDNFALFSAQLNQFLAFEVLDTVPAAETTITVDSVTFIGEQVIADGTEFSNTTVGGLSSIDYSNGKYYMISDDNNSDDTVNGPIRFYTASLSFDEDSFDSVQIDSVQEIFKLDDAGENSVSYGNAEVDPEGLRIDPKSGNLIWISEGQINQSINPAIKEMGTFGEVVRDMTIPSTFLISETEGSGPRHNVVFEGLSISQDGSGYWVAMEGPLEQDGPEASIEDTESPVRISFINRETGEFGRQFAYELDSVVRAGADGSFKVNGVVEILEYAENQFLVLERSFTAGEADGGNDVKLYKVDASSATDISNITALSGATITKATKTLLFDFETIRSQLTDGVVDNIEGITFGPDLSNGNKSLVVVADNNFSAFSPQLNQFIVFQVNP